MALEEMHFDWYPSLIFAWIGVLELAPLSGVFLPSSHVVCFRLRILCGDSFFPPPCVDRPPVLFCHGLGVIAALFLALRHKFLGCQIERLYYRRKAGTN